VAQQIQALNLQAQAESAKTAMLEKLLKDPKTRAKAQRTGRN